MKVPIKLIDPGWGTSGYYSREVLQAAAENNVFPKGTQMFMVSDEEHFNAERNPYQLAAVTEADAVWLDDGFDGEGLYSEAHVFADHQDQVKDKGKSLELSIVAGGKGSTGTVGDRQGFIVESIERSQSVDIVAKGGRGGKMLIESASDLPDGQILLVESAKPTAKRAKLTEAANMAEYLESRLHLRLTVMADEMFGDGYVNREERIAMSGALGAALTTYRESLMASAPHLYKRSRWSSAPDSADIAALDGGGESPPNITESEDDDMANLTEAQITAMQAENAQLKRQVQLGEAQRVARTALSDEAYSGVPASMKAMFTESAAAGLPLTADGKVDVVKITEAAQAAAKTYIESLPSGRMIEGNGDTGGDSLTMLREAEIKKLMETHKLNRRQAEIAYFGR